MLFTIEASFDAWGTSAPRMRLGVFALIRRRATRLIARPNGRTARRRREWL